MINGQDIRYVTQANLRKAIGLVPQDTILFNASIKHNIGYGRLSASEEEEIIAATVAAQMHEGILTFPGGYEIKVGERSVKLSGREKQPVAIAKTLSKNPPILLSTRLPALSMLLRRRSFKKLWKIWPRDVLPCPPHTVSRYIIT